MPMGTTGHSSKASRREWVGLAVLALPCLLYSMDLTVLNLAVPHLIADLRPSSSQLLWIVDIYGFLLAGMLIPMGALGDRIGRRRLLLAGAAGFGVASVFAAFATSPTMLIAARALLGVAAATLAPSTLSLIRNMFRDPGERTFAVSVWIASFSAGGAIGPLVGGGLLTYFWWGSVFLAAIPVMIVLLVVGPVLLPEFQDPDASRPDVFSAALSLAAVLAMVYGIKEMSAVGLGWPPLLAIVVGLAIGAVFVRRQHHLADPLIDLRLFRSRAFSASLAVNMLGFFIAFAAFLFIAQYLQLVIGMTPFQAGLWTLPQAGGFVAGSLLTPALVRRFRPSDVMAAGLLIAAAGFALLTQIGALDGLAIIVTASILFSLGLAPVFTLATDVIVGAAAPERAGAASAITETSSELGGALGIAVLGSIVTAVYRSLMLDAVPAGIPRESIDAARDTLGAALLVAADLPAPLGDRLAASAQAAFTDGFAMASIVCAVAALIASILAAFLLRRAGDVGPARQADLTLVTRAAVRV